LYIFLGTLNHNCGFNCHTQLVPTCISNQTIKLVTHSLFY
jgi:hypothetical protein